MAIVSKASEYIALKNRIKKEVLRRKYTGSVEAYGGANYDFTVNPVVGGDVLVEHYNKINEPARAINPEGLLENVKPKEDIREINILDAKTTIFESKPVYGSNHGCVGSCTGLCSSGCSGTCSGCNGCSGCSGCGGSCSYGCSGCSGCGGCGGACSSSCTSCSGCSGCSGGCGGCGQSCSGGCSGGEC